MKKRFSQNGQDPLDIQATLGGSRLGGLWRLMVGYRLIYLGALLFLGLAALMKTATYYLLRFLIDDVLGEERFDQTLLFVALGFIFLALFEGTFTFLSGRLAAQTSEGIALRLRNYLFDHIQRLSFAYHDKTNTGELIQRATSDVDAIRRFFAQEAIGFGRVVFLFSINFVAIYTLNAQLAFLSVIVIPIIVLMSYFFFKRITVAYEAYQEQEALLSTTLQENLTGVRVVKAFARQDYERQKFENDNQERYQRGRGLIRLHSLYWPASDILAGAQMIAGFFIGAIMTINGTITLGTYMAYAGMVIWIIWPMRMLGRLIVQMSQALVSYDRVTQVVKEKRESLTSGSHSPDGGTKGDIVFDNVCFEYDGTATVLHDISFQCRPGQRHYLRQQIGIVEQEPFLFSRTLRENIGYSVGRDVTDEEVVAAAKAAAIHDVILDFPNGYNTLVGERGVTLSGGQKQRITIARTLLKDPRILILDDATSSVDTETESVIRQALERLMENRTTFIIAHRIQSIMSADMILVLDQGRIIQKGTHAELVAQEGIYQEIYELQAQIEVDLEQEIGQLATPSGV